MSDLTRKRSLPQLQKISDQLRAHVAGLTKPELHRALRDIERVPTADPLARLGSHVEMLVRRELQRRDRRRKGTLPLFPV